MIAAIRDALNLRPIEGKFLCVYSPLWSADIARQRLLWCIPHDRAAVGLGRWKLISRASWWDRLYLTKKWQRKLSKDVYRWRARR